MYFVTSFGLQVSHQGLGYIGLEVSSLRFKVYVYALGFPSQGGPGSPPKYNNPHHWF